MPYEKYIKKNGKIYGPYLYRSKRVDGKVISEYVGESKISKKIPKKFLEIFVSFAIVIVILAMVFFSLNSGIFSGKAVSKIPKNVIPITGNSVNTETTIIPDINDGDFHQTARNYKNWIIVTFQFRENKIEYSYSDSLSQQDLDFLIEKDRINWLNKISS